MFETGNRFTQNFSHVIFFYTVYIGSVSLLAQSNNSVIPGFIWHSYIQIIGKFCFITANKNNATFTSNLQKVSKYNIFVVLSSIHYKYFHQWKNQILTITFLQLNPYLIIFNLLVHVINPPHMLIVLVNIIGLMNSDFHFIIRQSV